MLVKRANKIATFDDWVDLFRVWQSDIGLDYPELQQYQFEAKYGPLHSGEIEFGAYRGQNRWQRVRQIPDQRAQDALLNLIVYQGDTEFASVEQQRNLFAGAPTEYDRKALARVMTEEMRHGYQMCHLLLGHFGHGGRIEAQKLLERRAFNSERLLGSFNEDVENWLDFYTYTQFIDRDGKFQLQMLSHSAFAPLAQSMVPMLKEESFHLGTGNDGLRRIVKRGRVPLVYIQKYFNKWIPTAFDLFGTDFSSSAHWAYLWGLKGRYDEHTNAQSADLDSLNDAARNLYSQEVNGLIQSLNRLLPEGQTPFYTPDAKFNRRIGQFAGQRFSVTGEPLEPAEYERHLAAMLPQPADRKAVSELLAGDKDWIEPKGAEAKWSQA
ncbi:MAG: Phenylacetic acid catabolic protein [Terriglobales bacterium]